MKCSIMTIHHIHNFGSVFQAYALCEFLKENDFDVEIVDYRPKYYDYGKNKWKSIVARVLNYKSYCTRRKKFERFVTKYESLSEQQFHTVAELDLYYSSKEHIFIAGGDQLWNSYHPCGNDAAYKLVFAEKAKKIAYGTSMGRDNFLESELTKIADETKNFSRIMLREQSTVEMLKSHTNVSVSHVIDPVGLIDADELKKMAVKPEINEPYAVMYLADSSELLNKAIAILSKKLGLKIVHICGFKKKCYCDFFEKDLGPQEILGYILHAEFVLSASFHATMFSLLFNKQFATLLPGTQTNARIKDLLQKVNLENRIIQSDDKLKQIDVKIDYNEVNQIITDFRNKSRDELLNSLLDLSGRK